MATDRYRVRVVVGDRYGGDWPMAAFKRRSIVYRPAERTRSDIYRDVLPLLTSGTVELLDDPRLTRQLLALERRTTMGGRDAIDHPAGAHDDVANAMAGALLFASDGRRRGLGFRSDVGEIQCRKWSVSHWPASKDEKKMKRAPWLLPALLVVLLLTSSVYAAGANDPPAARTA
jgi:hypothetical protein